MVVSLGYTVGMADDVLNLRISKAQKARLQRWADRAGVSLHAFSVQALITGAVEHAKRLGVYAADDLDHRDDKSNTQA